MSFDELEEIQDDGPALNVPRKSTKVNLNAKINNSLQNAVLVDSELRSPTADQHFQNSIANNEGSTKPRMPTSDDNNFEGGEQEMETEVIYLNHPIPRPRLIRKSTANWRK